MLKISFWVFSTILIIEVFVNLFFPFPASNREPSALEKYFDYGRSTEEKITRMVGPSDSEAHLLSKVGWFKQLDTNKYISGGNGELATRVFVYGMSFSNRIADLIRDLSSETLDVRKFSGPAAPLNHSFAYYEKHRPYSSGDIVVLGILASSLSRVNTLTHMTPNFEQPGAHFYPRYRLNSSNQLVKYELEVPSLSKLREILNNENEWQQVKQKMSSNDSYFNSFIFEKNSLDYSVFARLLKRAWAQRSLGKINGQFYGTGGFKNSERLLDVCAEMIKSFASGVRRDGATPYIILFNDRGYEDHLYQALSPILESSSVPFYSTHSKFPAKHLSNFIPDGHFTDKIDREIAKAVLEDMKIITKSQLAQ